MRKRRLITCDPLNKNEPDYFRGKRPIHVFFTA